MTELAVALPVSVEQIAVAIKQMDWDDQKRLLTLVPTLQQVASQPAVRAIAQTQENITRLQVEVLSIVDNQPLSADMPFLGNLTLSQYHALSDKKKTELWDEWGADDLMELEEQKVTFDNLPHFHTMNLAAPSQARSIFARRTKL